MRIDLIGNRESKKNVMNKGDFNEKEGCNYWCLLCGKNKW